MHNQFKTQKFKHLMLAMGPRDLNSAPYSPVHCSSHSMTSFQSSELTELPVVENSQLFAQRAHSACTAHGTPPLTHDTIFLPALRHRAAGGVRGGGGILVQRLAARARVTLRGHAEHDGHGPADGQEHDEGEQPPPDHGHRAPGVQEQEVPQHRAEHRHEEEQQVPRGVGPSLGEYQGQPPVVLQDHPREEDPHGGVQRRAAVRLRASGEGA